MPDFPERQLGQLTLSDYFGAVVSLTKEPRDNAAALLARVNRLLGHFRQYRRIVRGFIPADTADVIALPYAPRTRHCTAQAVDLADPEGDLDQFVLDHQQLLETCSLWSEHPASTKGYCHLQSVAPHSGRRIFYP